MTQVLNDTNGNIAPQSVGKSSWTAPVIETYDVAAFTLGTGTKHFDATVNFS